ncbi:MAG TPA: MFS transporter, partial [Fibrobacteraceae bacterium]|nr:MFS transporter [Fibrobacteraceae bacterium]
MGLFIFFQRWLSFSYSGVPFLWRSALLQTLLLLPYIFMLAPASYFSNRYPKNKVMGYTALLMTLVLILIAVFYTLGLGWISYCLILLFSIFLSIESPAKLGIQKELFGVKRLTLSNAYQSSFSILGVVAVSFVTIGFSPEETSFLKYEILPWLFVIIGAIATLATFKIPEVTPPSKYMKLRSSRRTISSTWSNPLLRLCIIGLAFFWGTAQIFILLSQDISGMHIVSVLRNTLIFSAIGLVFGFLAAARASRNFIETGLIPTSALGAAVMMFLSAFISNELIQALVYGVIGFCAGIFFILVKALLQQNTRPDTAGRIIAVANMMQMLFLFTFLTLQVVAMSFISVSIDVFFIPLAVIAFIGFSLSLAKTPQTLLRA